MLHRQQRRQRGVLLSAGVQRHGRAMGRHSKDCGDLFTYAERKENGNGSVRLRLGEDSVRSFDHCSIGLSQPRMPVCCPAGFLFEKEAIVTALLQQKLTMMADIADRIRKADADMRRSDTTKAARAKLDAQSFVRCEESVLSSAGLEKPAPTCTPSTSAAPRPGIPLSSHFWLPPASSSDSRATPTNPDVRNPAATATPPAPSNPARRLRCPLSGRPLRLKDLRAVRFHGTGDASGGGRARHGCPVCSAGLTNASRPAVLPSGHVLCGRCVAQCVGEHGRDPIEDCAVRMKDVFYLQAGGTSFAASGGSAKEAKLYKPSAR